MAGKLPVQSVNRALDVLQTVNDAPNGLRLSELAEAVGLKIPTVHNLVRTLVERNCLVKDRHACLQIGPTLANLVVRQAGRALHKRVGELCLGVEQEFPEVIINVGEIVGADVIVRLRMSADRPGSIQHPMWKPLHLYRSAVGLACQAFADRSTVSMLRERHPFEEDGVNLWNSVEELDRFLSQARAERWLATPFPRQEIFRVAAPVYGADDSLLAALGAALPICLADDETQRRLSKFVQRTADILSEHSRCGKPNQGTHIKRDGRE